MAIFKQQKDLKKGDVIKVEFGDYDNFVNVIVDSIEDHGTKIVCHYKSGQQEIMFGDAMSMVEVIGG